MRFAETANLRIGGTVAKVRVEPARSLEVCSTNGGSPDFARRSTAAAARPPVLRHSTGGLSITVTQSKTSL